MTPHSRPLCPRRWHRRLQRFASGDAAWRVGEALRAEGRGGRSRPHRPDGSFLRSGRSQRRGQDHHAVDGDRTSEAGCRHGRHPRSRCLDQPVEAKKLIGNLADGVRLFDRLTGEQLVTYTGMMFGLTREEVGARTADLLQIMDLTEAAGTPVVDYSAGT